VVDGSGAILRGRERTWHWPSRDELRRHSRPTTSARRRGKRHMAALVHACLPPCTSNRRAAFLVSPPRLLACSFASGAARPRWHRVGLTVPAPDGLRSRSGRLGRPDHLRHSALPPSSPCPRPSPFQFPLPLLPSLPSRSNLTRTPTQNSGNTLPSRSYLHIPGVLWLLDDAACALPAHHLFLILISEGTRSPTNPSGFVADAHTAFA